MLFPFSQAGGEDTVPRSRAGKSAPGPQENPVSPYPFSELLLVVALLLLIVAYFVIKTYLVEGGYIIAIMISITC